jgi:hypothetical protein
LLSPLYNACASSELIAFGWELGVNNTPF